MRILNASLVPHSDPLLSSRQIKANLSDLMANSKYFASRLAGHLSPESSHLSDSVIFDPDEIPTYHVLKQVVQFLSSETNTNAAVLAESHVEQLIYAADFLQIDSVLRLLLAHLRIRMPNNCHPEDMDRRQVMLFLRLLNVLTRHWHLHSVEWDSTGTMICCEKHEKLTGPMTYEKTPQFYICYHFKSIMYEHALVTLTYRSIYALLLSDDLRISEEDVVRTIKMWINFDYKARIQHYSFLLKCVRFDPEMKVGRDRGDMDRD